MSRFVQSTFGIFAVEDDPSQLELLLLAIRALPVVLPVRTAIDGISALLQMQASVDAFCESVALVLLDLRLPRLHGLQLLQQAARLGLTERVPFVVFTSSDCSVEREQAMRSGARDFLVKPLGYRPLKQQMLQLFERWIAPRLDAGPAAAMDLLRHRDWSAQADVVRTCRSA